MSDKNLMRAIERVRQYAQEVSKTCEQHLNRFQMELINTQQRIAQVWNMLAGTSRMLEKIGIEQGWWKDREEYQQRYAAAVQEQLEEARERENKVLEEARRAGKAALEKESSDEDQGQNSQTKH